MKKLFFTLLSIFFIFTTVNSAYAFDVQKNQNPTIEYFDDGSYIITTISDEPYSISTYSSTTTTKSKISAYYSKSNSKLWDV